MLTSLAFDKLNAQKVEIFCDDENKASCSIPQKLGFELEYMSKGKWPRYDDTLAELRCYTLFSKNNLVSV